MNAFESMTTVLKRNLERIAEIRGAGFLFVYNLRRAEVTDAGEPLRPFVPVVTSSVAFMEQKDKRRSALPGTYFRAFHGNASAVAGCRSCPTQGAGSH